MPLLKFICIIFSLSCRLLEGILLGKNVETPQGDIITLQPQGKVQAMMLVIPLEDIVKIRCLRDDAFVPKVDWFSAPRLFISPERWKQLFTSQVDELPLSEAMPT
jgi:hypothetical protein